MDFNSVIIVVIFGGAGQTTNFKAGFRVRKIAAVGW